MALPDLLSWLDLPRRVPAPKLALLAAGLLTHVSQQPSSHAAVDDLEPADFFLAFAFFRRLFAIDSASQSFFFEAPLADVFRLLFHSAES